MLAAWESVKSQWDELKDFALWRYYGDADHVKRGHTNVSFDLLRGSQTLPRGLWETLDGIAGNLTGATTSQLEIRHDPVSATCTIAPSGASPTPFG
jgi:hypothetical protein